MLAGVVWFAGLLLLSAGCARAIARVPGEPAPVVGAGAAAASPLGEGALPWPVRIELPSGLDEATIRAHRARVGESWRPPGAVLPLQAPVAFRRITSNPSAQQTKAQAHDQQRLTDALITLRGAQERYTFEAAGAYVVRELVPGEDATVGTPRAGRATFMFQVVSLRPAHAGQNGPVVERTAFAYYEPALGWDDQGRAIDPLPTRAVVTLLPGMFGTPGDTVQDLTRRLRTRGVGVLRMLAHPARFTERALFMVPVEGDVSAAAGHIAAELTDRAAQCALAIEMARLYVRQQRPETADGAAGLGVPWSIVGMSGGAMVTPTVIARDPGAWAGAVLIGGGTDYLRILMTSNYTDWINALDVSWFRAPGENGEGQVGVPVTQVRREELWRAYRNSAPLDSANLAPRMAGKRNLLILGATDRAVPIAQGEELWQLLGRPERWTIDGGHEWLFFTLGRRLDEIAEWVLAGAQPDKQAQKQTQQQAQEQPEGRP